MKTTTGRSIDRSVILAATVSLAGRQYGFPSKDFWSAVEGDRSLLVLALILIAGVFGVLAPFETFSRRARVERRISIRRQILTTFGQLIGLRVASSAPAAISDLGLHIWQKKRTLKYPRRGELVRVATYRLGSTPVTRPIRPTLGVGVVGLCWQLDQEVGRNVEEMARTLTSEQKFNEYRMREGKDAVMGFSWSDFQRFKHRGAIFASPIRNGRSKFVGCISVDAAQGYDELDTDRIWHELNSLCVALGQDGFENV